MILGYILGMSSDHISTEDIALLRQCEFLNFDFELWWVELNLSDNFLGGSSLVLWNWSPATLLPSCMSRYFPISDTDSVCLQRRDSHHLAVVMISQLSQSVSEKLLLIVKNLTQNHALCCSTTLLYSLTPIPSSTCTSQYFPISVSAEKRLSSSSRCYDFKMFSIIF